MGGEARDAGSRRLSLLLLLLSGLHDGGCGGGLCRLRGHAHQLVELLHLCVRIYIYMCVYVCSMDGEERK